MVYLSRAVFSYYGIILGVILGVITAILRYWSTGSFIICLHLIFDNYLYFIRNFWLLTYVHSPAVVQLTLWPHAARWSCKYLALLCQPFLQQPLFYFGCLQSFQVEKKSILSFLSIQVHHFPKFQRRTCTWHRNELIALFILNGGIRSSIKRTVL